MIDYTIIKTFSELSSVTTEWAVVTDGHFFGFDYIIPEYDKIYRHWFKRREYEDIDSWNQLCVVNTQYEIQGEKYIDELAGSKEKINVVYYDEFDIESSISKSKIFDGWTWIIPKNHKIEKDLNWFPPDWEKPYCRIYKSQFGNEIRDGAMLVHTQNNGMLKYMDETISKEIPPAVSNEIDFSKSNWCFVVPDGEILIDTSYVPKTKKTHIWQTKLPDGSIDEYGDVRLYHSSSYDTNEKIFVKEIANHKPLQDVVFISYFEPNAEENYERLLKFASHAKHVKNIKGIGNAHCKAAELATTEFVYIVDGDAWIVDDFDFNFVPGNWDRDNIWVWRSKNPVNNLIYGYGGVKLFPRKALLDVKKWEIDFSLSFGKRYGFKIQERVSNITRIDSSPFQLWKSAVRECAKLSLKNDEISQSRINAWIYNSQGEYTEYAVNGGLFGIDLAKNGNIELINDFEYLENYFYNSN